VSKSAEQKKKSTILIVDDEYSIVDTLSAVLSIRGFEVLEAYSGEMARQLLDEHPRPDLIVLDILLPGVTGLELCQQLQADPERRGIPVMMITVITNESDVADGLWKIGTAADDFVSKPFDPFDLADRIERLLARSRDTRCSVS